MTEHIFMMSHHGIFAQKDMHRIRLSESQLPGNFSISPIIWQAQNSTMECCTHDVTGGGDK